MLEGNDDRIARALVAALYSSTLGETPGLDLAHLYEAAGDAHRAGGDLIDAYTYDNGSTSVIMADIAGHGIEAAMHAALVKYSMRAFASHGQVAEDIMRSLNTVYIENCRFEKTESFASIFLALIDADRRVMVYTSAGHECALLERAGAVEVLAPNAPLVGVGADPKEFRQTAVPLEAGDTLVAVTDGVTEARDARGEQFGADAVARLIAGNLGTSPEQLVQIIVDQARSFASDGGFHDDVAALVMRVAAQR